MMEKLIELKDEWANIPLLARTHGQAASPTLLGKEIMVFIERLERQMGLLNMVPFSVLAPLLVVVRLVGILSQGASVEKAEKSPQPE